MVNLYILNQINQKINKNNYKYYVIASLSLKF